ncbi:uncharacterized protein IL334_006852 [Kwoniella shivajii]|uniref:DUF803-domain-containing protein n=1 Tax=Kwoniella shivajii TaxID=564305 RepID=A0ABZ1DA50_9TREE|nr:hypothetical protein IL334_006852 [Kwoniella shivajii]
MVIGSTIGNVSTSSLIGVGIACGGNVLISLALTLQKLAHRRNQEAAESSSSSSEYEEPRAAPSENGNIPSIIQEEEEEEEEEEVEETPCPSPRKSPKINQDYSVVLIPDNSDDPNRNANLDDQPQSQTQTQSNSKSRSTSKKHSPSPVKVPMYNSVKIDSPSHETKMNGTANRYSESTGRSMNNDEDGRIENQNENENPNENANKEGQVKEGAYLKSRLWWLGQILITVGEGGNFLSYGFAPASVVAPLGTVALIANCVFAPLILREKFHKRELFGMALAIIGAVTVVWSSNGTNPRLNPQELIVALRRIPFIIYTILNFILLVTLIILSNSSYGHKYLLVDIGVCTVFGGYTVLSTKALSSLLSNDFFGSWNDGITWFLTIMVAATSIGQVRWLNRALMRFQSKEVIPTQFVFFSMAAIIGSAVLYQEFRDVPFSHFVNFAFGIATTFLGVHLLTTTAPSSGSSSSGEEEGEDNDDIGENRPSQPQRASSSASINLLLPTSAIGSMASTNERGTPVYIASPTSNEQTPLYRTGSYTSSNPYGSTPISASKVRLVRMGSNGEFTPALGIGSQAGLLLLATTPPSHPGILPRQRSTSRAMTIHTSGVTSGPGTNPLNEIDEEERGSNSGKMKRSHSAQKRTSTTRE